CAARQPDQAQGARRCRQSLGEARRADRPGRGHPTTRAVGMSFTAESLQEAFASAEVTTPADGIPTLRVPLAELLQSVERVRGELGHGGFVDVTAVDRLTPEDRFELVYLFYSMDQHTWLRLKTRTDVEAPSLTPIVRGANWYEREIYDLFGVHFVGHPD